MSQPDISIPKSSSEVRAVFLATHTLTLSIHLCSSHKHQKLASFGKLTKGPGNSLLHLRQSSERLFVIDPELSVSAADSTFTFFSEECALQLGISYVGYRRDSHDAQGMLSHHAEVCLFNASTPSPKSAQDCGGMRRQDAETAVFVAISHVKQDLRSYCKRYTISIVSTSYLGSKLPAAMLRRYTQLCHPADLATIVVPSSCEGIACKFATRKAAHQTTCCTGSEGLLL